MQHKEVIDPTEDIHLSLGSFSLSAEFTFTLLDEMQNELKEKKGKFDTDPDFWMPLTLDSQTYSSVTGKNDLAHYNRMQHLLQKITAGKPLFRNINIGKNSLWWDFGTMQSYFKMFLN